LITKILGPGFIPSSVSISSVMQLSKNDP